MLPVMLAVKNPRQISCQSNYTAIVTKDGQVYGCGQNTRGRLGSLNERSEVPTQIKELVNIVKVSCGLWHMLALTKDGVCLTAGNKISTF